MPEGLLFFDTVVLSNFAMARRLDIICSRYGRRVAITTEVVDELTGGISRGYFALREVIDLLHNKKFTRLALTDDRIAAYTQLIASLGPGEASCVACALEGGGVVVTDDRCCRNTCARRDIPFTGTIGILIASCLDGDIAAEEADEILTAMIGAGFYSPVRNISGLL